MRVLLMTILVAAGILGWVSFTWAAEQNHTCQGGHNCTTGSNSGLASSSSSSSSSSVVAAPYPGGSVTTRTEVPQQAPAVFAPALSVAPETCMGSASLGVSTPFGGIAGGKTYKDEDCNLRMFALSLQRLGLQEAALYLLAKNVQVREALDKAGVKLRGIEEKLTQADVSNTGTWERSGTSRDITEQH